MKDWELWGTAIATRLADEPRLKGNLTVESLPGGQVRIGSVKLAADCSLVAVLKHFSEATRYIRTGFQDRGLAVSAICTALDMPRLPVSHPQI